MSKQNILAQVKKNKPAFVPLPDVPDFNDTELDAIAQFKQVAEATGIQFMDTDKWSAQNVEGFFPKNKKIINLTIGNIKLPLQLADTDILILNGQFGVAENAAIWVDENNFQERILPFITQELVIVLEKKNIVQNMHQAYQKIKIDDTGFGVFIAGPSKTADIEQSLVIGAQGARRMFVVLT